MGRLQERPTTRDLTDHFRAQSADLAAVVEKLWDVEDAFEALMVVVGAIADDQNERQASHRLRQAAIYCDFDLDVLRSFQAAILDRLQHRCGARK